MSLLIAIGPMTQGQLKEKCKLTWGSITTHLKRLQDVQYVVQRHIITVKGPRVMVAVTSQGIEVYKDTLGTFRHLLSKMENTKNTSL
jgi:DNA-binding MarR family transcriptional regulator